MMRVKKALVRIRESFYRGPDWVDLPDLSVSGYRSPTALLAAWGVACLLRFMSPTGMMLGGMIVAIAMYSTILPRNSVVTLLFALVALYAIDFFAGLLMRPKLRIDRRLPERVRAGSELELVYRLRNLRSVPAWDISFDPGMPAKALVKVGEAPTTAYVPGHGELRVRSLMLVKRRGVFSIPRPLADSAFPFNLFKFSCRGGQAQTLIAHPSFRSLDSLRLPGGPRLQKLGLAAVSKVGESMEFHGCREFRTGDDPRKMHWLGTARTGEPVVKEFQEERLNRVALVLDTHCPTPGFVQRLIKGGPDQEVLDTFEASISLTAAIAEHLAKGEFIIDLFATGGKTWRFRGGRSLAQLDDILDILSCVEPSFDSSFELVDAALLQEISAIGAVLAVFTSADAKTEAFCRKVSDSGAGLRAIHVSSSQGPDWAEVISPDDIVAGRAVRL